MQSDIVFLGDSHTDYFEWNEHFRDKTISNQGIAGDTVENILKRINYVNSVNPKKIFVMMGINDLQGNKNPNAQIYIQSIFHVNKDKYPLYFGKDAKQLNVKIDNLNKDIADLSSKINNVYWINTNDIFGASNQLPSKYTIDGLHLNKKGYELWIKNLNKYIYH
ncbi:GDSL-type esterase/lipase family protein [Bacillus mobilis]|uniref:GDSL-type esterase/lipase family protein n=1 Tax=Bacillus mobilis TaxID=2026190 RepID=UPI002E1A8EC5|nr:GDSL-type esterase/lipase family protein [Bacillus mobilis]